MPREPYAAPLGIVCFLASALSHSIRLGRQIWQAHQGRGLARTLLYAGMRLLQARGATRAVLGTSSDNLAMQAAARAAGYRVESERIWLSWRAGE